MFKFSTKLNKEKINKFSNFRIFIIMPHMIVIATILILLGILFAYQQRIILSVIWILFGTLYIPTVLLFNKISQKMYNSKPQSDLVDTDEIYIFNEDEIIIKQSDISQTDFKTSFLYSDVYLFYKTKNDYVLYFSKEQTHIIPRKSIIEGSSENFEDYMKNRLGNLYREREFKI